MPLYYFAKDKAAGDVTGQNVGETWFVARPETITTGSTDERKLVIGAALLRGEWQTSHIIAAVAVAWALGISAELISAGLETFVTELPIQKFLAIQNT